MKSYKIFESQIFTKREIELLRARIKGSKKDPTGLYARKVKPKIIELLGEWIPLAPQLRDLVSKPGDVIRTSKTFREWNNLVRKRAEQ